VSIACARFPHSVTTVPSDVPWHTRNFVGVGAAASFAAAAGSSCDGGAHADRQHAAATGSSNVSAAVRARAPPWLNPPIRTRERGVPAATLMCRGRAAGVGGDVVARVNGLKLQVSNVPTRTMIVGKGLASS
jgi:hypothetical protein